MTPEQIFSLNKSSFRPVADGYVITGDQYKLYEAGTYNDVDVIIGSNSDEGGMFGGKVEPDAYKKAMQDRFGEYADRILAAYPGETEEQASYASMDITRETGFGWPGWTWARLQSRTGNSKVYMYYFEQKQPENTGRPMAIKLRGAPHAAEIKYVFKNIDTTRYSQDDVNLAEMMASYWTNFAKYGDPNGENLPVWPEFTEENQSVMYLKSTPEAGPVPHLENYQLMDEYFKTVRDLE
jgi:para-nitrobenzyl esterase